MDNIQIKKNMLDLFSSMHKELKAIVSRLTDEEKNARGSIEQWSVKDILVHLAFWGSHFNRQVEKAIAGQTVPVAGDYYEILNDGILMRNLDKPLEDARREEEAVFNQTIRLLEGMNEDELVDFEKYAFLEKRSLLDRALGTECWHVLSHISDYYVKKGQIEKAEVLQVSYTEKLKSFPTWKANAVYNLACFYSLCGKKEQALRNLKVAFSERPQLMEWSKQDTDIDPLRDDPRYQALLAEKKS